MRRILLVDDDPLVRRLYQEGLSQQGARVDTAADGVEAIQALRAAKPDVVVLDLMMPRFTGVDVLKFIRAQADLAALPVVVLSNSYMNEVARQAVHLGVQKALLKVRCSPAVLTGIINDICAGKASSEDPAHLLAVPKEAPAAPRAGAAAERAPAQSKAPVPATSPPRPSDDRSAAAQFQAKARGCLLDNAPATRAALRTLCQAIANATTPAEHQMSLQNLCRKLHFVAVTAGLAECHQLAQLTSAFEALLFELADKPSKLTPSVLRTLAATVDVVGLLFDRARDSGPEVPVSAQVLVVDDDPLSNRMVVAALRRASLQARSTEAPLTGLEWLEQGRYDLVLLDVEMPGIDGFEFCRRLRLLPGYQHTPVIYVTAHTDFESCAKSILSGGGDFTSKPVFPMELAVKALAHLLGKQLAA
jgi:CheY-like chemotaxis protein